MVQNEYTNQPSRYRGGDRLQQKMTGLRSSGSGLPALYVWTLADTVTGADVHRLFRVCVAIRTEILCDSIIGRYALVSFAKKEHGQFC